MSPDEIKAAAGTLAELYAAKAAGKTLQWYHLDHGWTDDPDRGPAIQSDLNRWRVKPEPRRMWEVTNPTGKNIVCTLHDEAAANGWKAEGYTVTEWQEVLP